MVNYMYEISHFSVSHLCANIFHSDTHHIQRLVNLYMVVF